MSINRKEFSASELVVCYGPPCLYRVQIGNKVMLGSGGPEMTVIDFEGVAPDGTAICNWLQDGELKSDTFNIVSLTCFGAK